MSNFQLPFDQEPAVAARIDTRDRAGRERAVDPRYNVALEASAGTGKTRVLVDRYVNLLRAGVDPGHILAITFTRKAAAEMRERIVSTLRAAAERGEIPPSRWRELRDRTADIDISTIDAFCLSLLREFPLEADLDPGFSMADDTEVPRLVGESLDRALRTCRTVAREDEDVALVFAQLGDRRARGGLAALLNRRLVAPDVLSRYLARGPRDLNVAVAAARGAARVLDVFRDMPGGLDAFIESGPPEPPFLLLVRQLRALESASGHGGSDPASVQAAVARVRDYFLTQTGEPRARLTTTKAQFRSAEAWQTHRDLVVRRAPAVAQAIASYRRDLNVLVARGVRRMYAIADAEYRRILEAHAVLDFPEVLQRTLALLRQMEEFAQSRYGLESRYHHVLVDEFQDTSRAQWELVSLLVRAWGEGAGLAHAGPLPPSIFIVGDRKQSIYSFRDADASILEEAAAYLEGLRPDRDVRRSISRSFRSVPPLLAFVNDVCRAIDKAPARRDAFRYEEADQFPIEADAPIDHADALGLVVGDSPEACAELTAREVARLVHEGATVRDRDTGVRRAIRPGDVGILFRTRESHREFEAALERHRIPAYVYKGLGFFDADEIKDVIALIWYLADPVSDLHAAALMRSRFVGLSDEGLRRLGPRLADALRASEPPHPALPLEDDDRHVLELARRSTRRWRGLVDRLPPAELLDVVVEDSAYAMELRGPRYQQARENLKKIRALIRRIQNRGYATLDRIVAHLDRLAVGDEANAAIDALDAVNLMTVHASKGLEFPVVFVVNLARGTGNRRDPIRVSADPAGDEVSVAVGDFQSDADDDGAAREREETKRLLYVALTRARDRLYLASVLKDGRVQPGRGSLADVLPPTLIEQFAAAMGAESVEWQAEQGARHRMHVCGGDRLSESPRGPDAAACPEQGNVACDFDGLVDRAVRRRTVAAVIADAAPGTRVVATGSDSSRLTGTLVHRLIQRAGLGAGMPDAQLRALVLQWLRGAEVVDDSEEELQAEAILSTFVAFRDHPVVHELYARGRVLHEVPFTMRREGEIVRGTIDCVVVVGDSATVLEFKTGRPRPEHDIQAAIYRDAVAAIFPGLRVESRLIYAGGSDFVGTRPATYTV